MFCICLSWNPPASHHCYLTEFQIKSLDSMFLLSVMLGWKFIWSPLTGLSVTGYRSSQGQHFCGFITIQAKEEMSSLLSTEKQQNLVRIPIKPVITDVCLSVYVMSVLSACSTVCGPWMDLRSDGGVDGFGLMDISFSCTLLWAVIWRFLTGSWPVAK